MSFLIFFVCVILFLYSIKMIKTTHSYFFPLFFSFIFIYTFIGSMFFSFAKEIPFENQLIVSTELIDSGLAFVLASIFFIIGIKIGSKKFVFGRGNLRNKCIPKKNYDLEINSNIAIFFIFVTIVFSLISYDLSEIISRDTYVFEINSTVANIYKILFMISSFLCAFISRAFLRYLFLISLMVIPFSMNSRVLLVGLILFFMGILIKRKTLSFIQKIIFPMILFLSFFTTLSFREMPTQGLIPNLMNLWNFNISHELILKGFNYTTSYSVYLVDYAIVNNIGDLKSFIMSINPLPGKFLNMDTLIESSKVNAYAPAPAIAMIYNQGPILFFIYYFFCGIFFQKILSNYRFHISYSIFLGMFLMFTFLNTQYIIRESARLVYYSIFFSIIISVLNEICRKKYFR